jgi:hypothetical protein
LIYRVRVTGHLDAETLAAKVPLDPPSARLASDTRRTASAGADMGRARAAQYKPIDRARWEGYLGPCYEAK